LITKAGARSVWASTLALLSGCAGRPDTTNGAAIHLVDLYKLIRNTRRLAGDPEFELYEHLRDPRDQTDVSAEHPEIVARLARELEAWRRSAEAARLKPDTESAQTLSSEDLERLRALGYIQ
jgi:hypothetical protein